MRFKTFLLTTALALAPSIALATTPTPPTCPTTPGLVYAITSRCLLFVAGTNDGDQRDCFDALQAVDTLQQCTHATLTWLVNNPTVTPPPKKIGQGF